MNQDVFDCRSSTSLTDVFMDVVQDKDCLLLDLACGPGNVAQVVRLQRLHLITDHHVCSISAPEARFHEH